MSEKKFLPDVTRRDVLKGIAKGAAASQAPAISGLSSLVKGVKTGLDIHKKLDLTKNIIQELLSLERQFNLDDVRKYDGIRYAISKLKEIQRQEEINPYPEDSPNHLKEEQSQQRRKERFFPNEEPDIKEIINFIENEGRYAGAPPTKITKNDIVRILDLIKKETKLLDIAKKYDLPLQYMFSDDKGERVFDISNYQRSKRSFNLQNFLENKIKNFDNKIRPKFLEEYNTPNEEIFEGYIGSHGGKFKQQELFNRLNKEMINKYGKEEAMYAGEREGPMLTTKVDYDDPLVKEYRKELGVDEEGYLDLYDDYQGQYELMLDSEVNNPQRINTKEENEIVNYVKDIAGDFFKDYANKKLYKKLDYAGKKLYKKLGPDKQEQIEEKKPKAIEGPKLSDTQTIEGEAKRIPEPEGLDIEVENVEEIQQKNPVLAQRIVNLLGKSLRRSPYVFGLTPTQMGVDDGPKLTEQDIKKHYELMKNQQGNLIQKRKGGTVMKNYYKNYNTQRTI